jgi:hypothetical protein
MYVRVPVSRPAYPKDPRWFFGKKIKGRGLRKWPEEKAQLEKLLAEDQEFASAVQKTRQDKRNLLRS